MSRVKPDWAIAPAAARFSLCAGGAGALPAKVGTMNQVVMPPGHDCGLPGAIHT